MLEQIWPTNVSLDIALLELSVLTFLAGIVTFLYEEFSSKSNSHGHMCHGIHDTPGTPSTPGTPASHRELELLEMKEQKSPKVVEPEQKAKAREDLPEPEPEGCDEEAKKFLEVILERFPGEAWGLCWQRTAFDEERFIFAGVDPNSPAGQQQRKEQGLPLLERGDELICVNDLSQHSSMKMALVVSNRLRLKFIRSDWVIAGADSPEAYKEVMKACPPPETLEEPNEIEDDIEDSAEQYSGLQLNFWSYQRPPRACGALTLTADVAHSTVPVTPSPPHLRARSDPPKQSIHQAVDDSADGISPERGPREKQARKESCARSTSGARNHGWRTEATHEIDGHIFSGDEHSDAQCPSTDWEYMMDNRDGQARTAAANGSVLLVAGSQAYALQTPGVVPCNGLLPTGSIPLQHFGDMPGAMQEASSLAAGGGMQVPMPGFQGMYPQASGSGGMVGWNYWQAPPQPVEMMAAPQDDQLQRTASPPRSKKTYRAGHRLTARRLKAAQRAAEQAPLAANSEASDGAEAVEGSTRTKPRRRAGVRVRRRREHALKRREAAEQGQAAEPLPPGLRDAPFDHTAQTEASRDGGASSKASHATRPSVGGRSRGASSMAEPAPQESCERDIIGEKVLINGLVQAPHLNGHWGHVTDYDLAQRRYAVQVLGAPLLLHLRREVLVLPKTSPPGPEELRGKWQPNLRM